jgi:hypothetical protein
MITSTELHNKLKDKNGRIAKLVADPRPVPDKIREIYLWVYSRPPVAKELTTIQNYLKSHGSNKEAYEDVFWALLNTKEFLFNH